MGIRLDVPAGTPARSERESTHEVTRRSLFTLAVSAPAMEKPR